MSRKFLDPWSSWGPSYHKHLYNYIQACWLTEPQGSSMTCTLQGIAPRPLEQSKTPCCQHFFWKYLVMLETASVVLHIVSGNSPEETILMETSRAEDCEGLVPGRAGVGKVSSAGHDSSAVYTPQARIHCSLSMSPCSWASRITSWSYWMVTLASKSAAVSSRLYVPMWRLLGFLWSRIYQLQGQWLVLSSSNSCGLLWHVKTTAVINYLGIVSLLRFPTLPKHFLQ